MNTRVTLHPCANAIYRKTRRPPAEYSADIGVVVKRCRANGGEEDAIALLPEIFIDGISGEALIRNMTSEQARKHSGGTSTQVYRTLLRGDDAGRVHCRLCAVGADEGGWKNPRDALRHLKRNHFGIGDTCIQW